MDIWSVVSLSRNSSMKA